MKKTILIISVLVFAGSFINAQVYSEQSHVFSSSGKTSNNSTYLNFGVLGESFVNENIVGQSFSGRIGFLVFLSDVLVNNENYNQIGYNKIYPNPAKDKITITDNRILPGETILSIFNMKGEQLMFYRFQNQNMVEFDVSTLAKDIYLVRIQTKSGIESKKLVIQ